MTMTADSLDSFGRLATAIGLLDPNGQPNSSWFGDPMGATAATGNQHGLRHLLADDAQRTALFEFVDEILGPPDQRVRSGKTWVPLFSEQSITLYAVVEAVAGQVELGIGLDHNTGTALPRVTTRIHVPVFRFARRGGPALTGTGDLPAWLMLGTPGARIGITVDATFTESAPPPGEAGLGGVSVGLGIPTASGDDFEIEFELQGLQLPGAGAPRTFSFDASSLEELGSDVFDLVLGLVRAQADALSGVDPALAPFRAVAGLLGLRDVGGLPPLPLAELPTRGIAALVGWVEQVLADNTARDAWLGELAGLLGGTLIPADDAVRVTAGPLEFVVGIRVQPGSTGHPLLIPRAEIALNTGTGARARLTADLLRADTGTGVCTALPALRAEAVFGHDAGGADLIPGAATQAHLGSVHTGIALDPAGRPAFVLTLHDVVAINGGPRYDVLDLSSPSAALNAATDLLEEALADAIADLGPAGVLINRLIGLDPPAGINSIDVPELLADPLKAIRDYWQDLTGTTAASADVLGRLRSLVTGEAFALIAGAGTAVDPWRVELVEGVELDIWRDGTTLSVDLVGAVTTPVLGEHEVTAALGVMLLRADLATGTAAFVVDMHGKLSLGRQDGQPVNLPLGSIAIVANDFAIEASWSPAHGLRTLVGAEGLAVLSGETRIAVSLSAPDWAAIEQAAAALLAELGIPTVDVLLELAGWTGSGARLSLEGLLGLDPGAAVQAWLADLVLDCDNVRTALGPVAALLSGFHTSVPFGSGSVRTPYRCPVAGEARAPGLAVWMDPGCATDFAELLPRLTALSIGEEPEPATIVGVLRGAAVALPDVGDLMVGRDSLAEGLGLLLTRWTGTDGLTGQPATLPDDVTALELGGLSYDELVALGSVGLLVGDVIDPAPAAVIHVGCEATWTTDRPAGTAFDRTGTDTTGAIPGSGGGTWFVRLPTPAAAAIARPDRGGVGEQAARLNALLADRADPVVVIAYGACGAAAIRAAATVPAVSIVVTVGTPWAGLSVDSLRNGLGGDALRLLERLRLPDVQPWPDQLMAQQATPHEQTRRIIQRSLDELDLPSAGGEARRAGLTVQAVFGQLDESTLKTGLGAFVADGINARIANAIPPAGADDTARTGLHAALDVPVIDLDLGGLLVGIGARVELCRIGRATPGPGLEASLVRGVVLDVHLGVHDGWLVGGPGSGSTVGDLRWMSAQIDVPLDGRPGDAELVLHEARGFGIDRERWVVRADAAGAGPDVPAIDITGVVPEVRVLLSDVVARLRLASPDLAAVLDLIGLSRAGGLDPDGLDRLLHDTAVTLRGAVTASATELATRLRALVPAATGTGSSLNWTIGPATIGFDLAAGTLTANLTAAPLQLQVAMTSTGASATASIGTAGGLQLVARTLPNATVSVDWAGREVALLPTPDPAALQDLATTLLPAVTAHGLLSAFRQLVSSTAAPLLDTALDAVGLLTPADPLGFRGVVVPIGLVQDPGAWLRQALPLQAANAVALLDALAPLVAPNRGAATGWPLGNGVAVGYGVEAGDQLRLTIDVGLAVNMTGGTIVTTQLGGGLLIGPDALPHPTLELSVDVDGRGLALVVAPSTDPPVRLSLLRPPAPSLQLYPGGPGLGDTITAVGETVVPIVLNTLAGHRNDAGTALVKAVGQAVFDVGGALDLREGATFTAAKVTAFATDPATRLTARLPQLIASGAGAIANALDPAHALVEVTPGTDLVTLGFGVGRDIRVVLDASGVVPAIEIQADVEIDGVGRLMVERLRLSTAGVDVAVTLGPIVLDLGAFSLRPLIVVRAGTSDRMVGVGLALDDLAARAVEFRWGLDASPPTLAAVRRTGTAESLGTEAEAGQWLLALALSIAGGVVVDGLRPVLTVKAKACLQGVVFTDVASSTEIDPGLALDLLNPDALLARLKRLLWNAAQAPALSVTLDGVVTIGLAATGTTTKQLGINISLAPNQRFTIAEGDVKVELEVDASWVNPAVPAGLSIYVLSGPDAATLAIVPAVSVAGLGLRFTKMTGALLSLGAVSLDGIALHLYGEATPAGIGGGVNLELAGLAFSPSAGGGSNGVANSIMNDAGQAGPASRPAFSPSIAVQKHPGLGPTVSLRAGPPPGPWWIVVQRQLGPLYLERVGLDTVETAGTVSRISLLFDGRVSIFGLTAAVDRLSISWTGGDVLDIDSWAVDLMGLAVSADMAGVSLSGGMLKTIGPPENGPVSYVGMLLGRFGIYGLSVFGGYTDDNGNPSFFVFGAINGPIGGPPAFFITGIGGGLGINRGLRIPDDVTHFNDFPFIKALDPASRPSDDPMGELRKLNEYFPPQRGNFWFAAGISFNSFALVDGIAVIAVSFGDGLEINLLGLARMALPRPEAALISIELGLLARFSTREGLFMIRAGLTENSWLLYPEVRLTGGFAFAIWWKGPLAGQFVMTLGGYHPDFHREGYPEVPRLGLIWRVSDAIVIKGGSYFALTSEALMAGVDVEVSANFGWAWARIAFGAHGIVYFDPFWFEVMAYARISAGIKISTFFGTISFSISIGAKIKVWGPDFSGEATLEIGPCDITVGFGSDRKTDPRTLAWAEFVAKYLEDAGSGTARALSAITGRGTLPAATNGDRSAPTSDGTADRPFEVYAEFELTVVTTVPTSRVDVDLATGVVPVPVIRSDGLAAGLGLKPMKAGSLSSTLRIRLEQRNPSTGVWEPINDRLRLLGANLAAAQPRPEGSTIGRDSFPIGAWGSPEAAGLPAPLPQGDVVQAGNLVRLVAEATNFARGPEIDYYKVEAARRPLPLQAGGPDRGNLLQQATTVVLPVVSTVAAALEAASAQLFAAQAPATPVGLLATGERSVLAKASYRGEVAAPPLFGTLADGMAEVNSADADAGRVEPGPGKPLRKLRTPVVAGYLTAGSRVAERAGGTTVADRRLKRRTAPTLDSVQARLGAHLPIRLHTTTLPSVELQDTLAAVRVPRTEAVGAIRSYPLGASGLTGLVGGLDSGFDDNTRANRRISDEGRMLASGEVVVLALPDASVDVGDERPQLIVDGQARVTVLRGDGEVAVDAVVRELPVPAGAALVAVQADGSTGSGDGLAGWHLRSRVCSLGSHAALAAGCVITADGGPTVQGAVWVTAAELLAGAAATKTWFSHSIQAVAVVVEEGSGDRLESVELDITGTRRAVDAEGNEMPPIVLLSGDQAVLIYPLQGGREPVAVQIRSGGDWQVTGVLGGDRGVEALSQAIVRDGVVAAAGRLLSAAGNGCRMSWIEGR